MKFNTSLNERKAQKAILEYTDMSLPGHHSMDQSWGTFLERKEFEKLSDGGGTGNKGKTTPKKKASKKAFEFPIIIEDGKESKSEKKKINAKSAENYEVLDEKRFQISVDSKILSNK